MTKKKRPDLHARPWTFLSWGVGLQSTTLFVMSALGDLPLLDCAFFADSQWERARTYESFRFYRQFAEERGIPVRYTTAGNIRHLAATEHVHIPFWTTTGAPLKRQCTQAFKIIPVRQAAREFAGFHMNQPPHTYKGQFRLWLGISLDEWTRAGEDRRQFIQATHPLLDLRMTRQDCEDYLQQHGLPIPEKSACIGCPFRQASEWIRMRDEAPEEFADAIRFDEENRDNPLARRHGKVSHSGSPAGSTSDQIYVWRGAIPLRAVDLEAEAA